MTKPKDIPKNNDRELRDLGDQTAKFDFTKILTDTNFGRYLSSLPQALRDKIKAILKRKREQDDKNDPDQE